MAVAKLLRRAGVQRQAGLDGLTPGEAFAVELAVASTGELLADFPAQVDLGPLKVTVADTGAVTWGIVAFAASTSTDRPDMRAVEPPPGPSGGASGVERQDRI